MLWGVWFEPCVLAKNFFSTKRVEARDLGVTRRDLFEFDIGSSWLASVEKFHFLVGPRLSRVNCQLKCQLIFN